MFETQVEVLLHIHRYRKSISKRIAKGRYSNPKTFRIKQREYSFASWAAVGYLPSFKCITDIKAYNTSVIQPAQSLELRIFYGEEHMMLINNNPDIYTNWATRASGTIKLINIKKNPLYLPELPGTLNVPETLKLTESLTNFNKDPIMQPNINFIYPPK